MLQEVYLYDGKTKIVKLSPIKNFGFLEILEDKESELGISATAKEFFGQWD